MYLTRTFHVSEVFIDKAFEGAAVVNYCKSSITQPMGASGSARRVKNFQGKYNQTLNYLLGFKAHHAVNWNNFDLSGYCLRIYVLRT